MGRNSRTDTGWPLTRRGIVEVFSSMDAMAEAGHGRVHGLARRPALGWYGSDGGAQCPGRRGEAGGVLQPGPGPGADEPVAGGRPCVLRQARQRSARGLGHGCAGGQVHRLWRAGVVEGLLHRQGDDHRAADHLLWRGHHAAVLGQRRAAQPVATGVHQPVRARGDSLQHPEGRGYPAAYRAPPFRRLRFARGVALRHQPLAAGPFHAAPAGDGRHALVGLPGGYRRAADADAEKPRQPEGARPARPSRWPVPA